MKQQPYTVVSSTALKQRLGKHPAVKGMVDKNCGNHAGGGYGGKK
jgi:hypothetical protein